MDFAQGSVQDVIGPAGGGHIPGVGNGTEVEMNNSFNVEFVVGCIKGSKSVENERASW